MPRGPLPNPDALRSNPPTIKANVLPAAGRSGPPPPVPEWRTLGESGSAWWSWAWSTPQAAAWPTGSEDFVARRAALEDDLRILDESCGVDLEELLCCEPTEALQTLKWVIQRLHGMASGRLAVMKEMRELDNRLGLNPKAMADLRWTIADVPLTGSAQPRASTARKKTNGRRGAALKVLTGGTASA